MLDLDFVNINMDPKLIFAKTHFGYSFSILHFLLFRFRHRNHIKYNSNVNFSVNTWNWIKCTTNGHDGTVIENYYSHILSTPSVTSMLHACYLLNIWPAKKEVDLLKCPLVVSIYMYIKIDGSISHHSSVYDLQYTIYTIVQTTQFFAFRILFIEKDVNSN